MPPLPARRPAHDPTSLHPQRPHIARRRKPFALLTANPTREHHYTAQTEQRQYAHNPQVAPQNQNVYRLDKTLFAAPAPTKARGESVNINGNLAAQNLYTLTRAAQASEQYNLESWFNRHESGYEDACEHLRTLPRMLSENERSEFRQNKQSGFG